MYVRNAYKILVGKSKAKSLWKRSYRLDDNTKKTWCVWTEFNSGQEPVLGSCEHGNEHLGSIKDRECLDQLSNN
jgi:hypothetical protein